MGKEPSFYMALPLTKREKLRERQKLKTYREYTKNLTGIDVNKQMDAESEYLVVENQILFRRLTNNDTELLDITPDNFRILGRLAKRLLERYRDDITIMSYEDLIRGYEYYESNPPSVNQTRSPWSSNNRLSILRWIIPPGDLRIFYTHSEISETSS